MIRKHKILLVDDEPNIVMSLEYLFKKEGFSMTRQRKALKFNLK